MNNEHLMQQDKTKRFLDTKDLAEYLSLSENTVRAWVRQGYLPFTKFGGAVRFDLLKINKWIKGKESAALDGQCKGFS